jgi:hypothetical protein
MNMAFREKSIGISLSGLPEEAALGLSLRAISLIIIVEIIFQGMLAVSNRKAAEHGADERDTLFAYKGNNFGYTVLAIGVFISLGWNVLLEINPAFIAQSNVLKVPLLTAHILLFSFIFSEVVRFSAQLYNYTRCD